LYGVANVNILWLVAVSPLIENNHGLLLDSSISLIKGIQQEWKAKHELQGNETKNKLCNLPRMTK